MIKQSFTTMRLEEAETIGLQGLTFLLGEPNYLERFLGETGLTVDALRADAGSREVLDAAVTVLLNDEALLLSFTGNAGLAPEDVVQAHQRLANDAEGPARPPSP